MTASVALGLTLQSTAVAVTGVTIRGRWLRHTGALLLLAVVTYHGITEVMQWIWPGHNPYRLLVSQDDIDEWMVLVSVAILLYAVSYAVAVRRWRAAPPERPADYVCGLRLWWLLVLALPLLVVVVQGGGSLQPSASDIALSSGSNLVGSLAVQFLVLLAAITGAVAIVRVGARRALLILVVEAAALSLAGARTAVVMACLLSVYGATLAGVRLPRRQFAGGFVVVAVLGMMISVARAEVGRDSFHIHHGADERLSALLDGARALPTAAGRAAVLDDVVYRFDGNVFGAMVYHRLRAGAAPVGLTTVTNNLLLAVPSAVYPDKLKTPVESRSAKYYLVGKYGLPYPMDFLPGMLGEAVSYYGGLGLLLFALVLGLAFARVDAWVARTANPFVFLVGIGMAQCVLTYEKGTVVYPTILPGVLLLSIVVYGASRLSLGGLRLRGSRCRSPRLRGYASFSRIRGSRSS